MNKLFATIFISLVSLQICIAGSITDSLRQQLDAPMPDTQKLNILNRIGKSYEDTGNDSAIYYYAKAREISKKLGEKRYLAISEQNFGCFFMKKLSFDTALTHHKNALSMFVQLGDSNKIVEQYEHMFRAYYNTSQFDKALRYNLKAIEINDKLGNLSKAVMLRSNLSDNYMKLNNPDKALKCLFDVIEFEPREEVKEHISSCYINIGYIYLILGKYEESLDNISKSLIHAKELDIKPDIALAYAMQGKVYLKMELFDKAEKNMMIARGLFEELNDRVYLNKVNINLAELYNALKRYPEAAHYAEESIKVSREVGVLWMENLAQFSLAIAQSARGKYKEAYHAMHSHKCVNDRIQAEIRTKEIADIQIKYETEKKEKENALLRKDNEIQKKARNFFIIFSVLILILGLLLLNRYLIKRRINKELVEKNNLILKQQKELSDALEKLKDTNEELEQQKEEIQTQAEVLEEANATKDKFFSIIAHDLKNPFNAILGLSEIMIRRFSNSIDSKFKEYIYTIHSVSNTTYKLLSNLLDWARSQSNRIEIRKEELNLADLIESSIKPYLENAEAKELSVLNQIAPNHTIKADKYTLSTVFGNLFSNAVKFTKKGGSITLDTHDQPGHIAVNVKDTGVGIPDNAMNKLFKITENYSTEGTQKEQGSGLGLILCKEFVEKNNCKIKVKSTEGSGTTFTVSIPVE